MAQTALRKRVAIPKSELPPGSRTTLTVGPREVVVFNEGGECYALLDRCFHKRARLSGGQITRAPKAGSVGEMSFEDGSLVVRCPWHHYEIDLRTGHCFAAQGSRVATYQVRDEGDEYAVYIDLGGGVDVDFWPKKVTVADIAPFVDSGWREWLRIGEFADLTVEPMVLTEDSYFFPGTSLQEAAVAEDPQSLTRERLNRAGVSHAIVNCGAATNVSGYPHAPLSDAITRAANQWTAQWLDVDERLRGSIVVQTHDTAKAAAEVRRAAADPRMVQVVMAYPEWLLGDRTLYPIYEAACEHGLPVMLQAGGAYSGSNTGLTVIGAPASAFEALLSWEYGAQPHVINAVTSGLFHRFPELRVILSGYGVAWLPSLLWRLDHEYRAQRLPVPGAIRELPSDVLREHISLTTATLELPPNPAELATLLTWCGGSRLLLYGSGPLDSEEGQRFLEQAGKDWAQAVRHDNPHALYRLTAEPVAA